MKVFLEANVLFSAALSAAGTAQALLVSAHAAGARCASSERAFAEAHRNLVAKAPSSLPTLELIAAVVGRVPEPHPIDVERARSAGVADDDAPVLGAALAAGADWFVTGDVRHFGHLFGRSVEGVLVLRLREAVDRLSTLAKARPRRGRSR